MASRRELSESQRAQIWALHCSGKSGGAISRQLDLHRTTITRTIARVTENLANGYENPYISKPKSGRPPLLDVRAVRHLLHCTTSVRFDTYTALSTPGKCSLQINRSTVRRILKTNGKARQKARKKPWISPANRLKRLIFKKRNKWTPWPLICWSDEVYFEIGEDNRSCYVTRTSKEEFHPDCLQPTFKSGRTKVGAWGCFMGPEKGPIVILPQGTRLNRQEYTDQIFIPHFLPFYLEMRRKYGHGVQLQEDGASYHHNGWLGKLKRAWLIRSIIWPAQSPDLSPIENLWAWMKDRIGERRHRIKNIIQMSVAIREAWDEITPEVLMKLVDSMPKRMDLLQASKGGPIKY